MYSTDFLMNNFSVKTIWSQRKNSRDPQSLIRLFRTNIAVITTLFTLANVDRHKIRYPPTSSALAAQKKNIFIRMNATYVLMTNMSVKTRATSKGEGEDLKGEGEGLFSK